MFSFPSSLRDADVLVSTEVMLDAIELTIYCRISARHLSLASFMSSLWAKTEKLSPPADMIQSGVFPDFSTSLSFAENAGSDRQHRAAIKKNLMLFMTGNITGSTW